MVGRRSRARLAKRDAASAQEKAWAKYPQLKQDDIQAARGFAGNGPDGRMVCVSGGGVGNYPTDHI